MTTYELTRFKDSISQNDLPTKRKLETDESEEKEVKRLKICEIEIARNVVHWNSYYP